MTVDMTLACQFGRCGECPERDDPDGECICECHIDDDSPEARDWADEVRAHAVYGKTA